MLPRSDPYHILWWMTKTQHPRHVQTGIIEFIISSPCVWEVTVEARIMLSACASFRRAFHTHLSIYSHSSRKTISMAPTDRQSVGSAAVVSLSSSALRRRHGRRIRLQWCSSGSERICTSSAAGKVALCHAAHCLQRGCWNAFCTHRARRLLAALPPISRGPRFDSHSGTVILKGEGPLRSFSFLLFFFFFSLALYNPS